MTFCLMELEGYYQMPVSYKLGLKATDQGLCPCPYVSNPSTLSAPTLQLRTDMQMSLPKSPPAPAPAKGEALIYKLQIMSPTIHPNVSLTSH